MSDVSFEQKHAIDVQLLAIRCGALYGSLAIGGLIATHLVLGGAYAGLGALLAVIAALFAYLNFSIIASNAESIWINRTQILSICAGLLSGLLVLASALS